MWAAWLAVTSPTWRPFARIDPTNPCRPNVETDARAALRARLERPVAGREPSWIDLGDAIADIPDLRPGVTILTLAAETLRFSAERHPDPRLAAWTLDPRARRETEAFVEQFIEASARPDRRALLRTLTTEQRLRSYGRPGESGAAPLPSAFLDAVFEHLREHGHHPFTPGTALHAWWERTIESKRYGRFARHVGATAGQWGRPPTWPEVVALAEAEGVRPRVVLDAARAAATDPALFLPERVKARRFVHFARIAHPDLAPPELQRAIPGSVVEGVWSVLSGASAAGPQPALAPLADVVALACAPAVSPRAVDWHHVGLAAHALSVPDGPERLDALARMTAASPTLDLDARRATDHFIGARVLAARAEPRLPPTRSFVARA